MKTAKSRTGRIYISRLCGPDGAAAFTAFINGISHSKAFCVIFQYIVVTAALKKAWRQKAYTPAAHAEACGIIVSILNA